MTFTNEHIVTGLVALAIVAHAWSSRIVGPPKLLSMIGWVLNALVVVALVSVWVRC